MHAVTVREILWDEFCAIFPKNNVIPDSTGYTSGRDLEAVMMLCRGHVLEFGTAAGHTTLWLARNGATVTTVDVESRDMVTEGAHQREQIEPAHRRGQHFIGTPEQQRIRQVLIDPNMPHDFAALGGPFDSAFVDSLHTFSGVAKDTETAMLLVRDGGMIVWDDYRASEDGVNEYLDGVETIAPSVLRHVHGTRIVYASVTDELRKAIL